MGQATRTTRLEIDLGKRRQGGTNLSKRTYLQATMALLDRARAFYIEFFLVHAEKLTERVSYFSEQYQEQRERRIGADELLSLSRNARQWKPVIILNHGLTGTSARLSRTCPSSIGAPSSKMPQEAGWEQHSPSLILRPRYAALHIPQVKAIAAQKVQASKMDPHLVTVAVDLNIKNLAVITVRQDGRIIETVFVRDHGLDQHRYGHLKRITKKQWQSGKPVKGEHSNQQLWQHIDHLNEDAAHQVARSIANVCAKYAGCVLLFERLRKITANGGSTSRRMNRKRANQLRGKINRFSREQAFAQGTVTVEVNPHGTSQYCSRCGAKGERFSYLGGKRSKARWGKLFRCPLCHYEANADFNASVTVHRAFYRQWHWQPRKKPPPKAVQYSSGGDPLKQARPVCR